MIIVSLIVAISHGFVQQTVGQTVTWEAAVVVDAASGSTPDLAASGSVLHTVWVKHPSELHYMRSLDDGMTWQDDYLLSANVGTGGWIVPAGGQVAADGDLVAVAWTEITTDPEVRVASSANNGATWAATQQLTAATADLMCSGVALSGTDVAVLWKVGDGLSQTQHVRVSHDSSGTWEPQKTVTDGVNSSGGLGDIAIVGSSLVVLYADASDAKATTSTDWGDTWGNVASLASDPSLGFYHMRGLAASGGAVLAHVAGNTSAEHIVAGSGDDGLTWAQRTGPTADAGAILGDIALSGTWGFMMWDSASQLHYTTSVDGGLTWGAPEGLAGAVNDATGCVIAAPYVYVAGIDPTAGGVSVRRGLLSGSPPTVTATVPAANEVLPGGTTSTPLVVAITDHPAPGHWHWQLATPFANTGVAGGNHVDPGVLADTIPGLVDGGAYTVYVALVADADHNLIDATGNADARASVAFSVDTGVVPPTVSIVTPTDGQELPPSTATTTLSVGITDHAAGTWAWRLDTAFPDTGAVPIDANPVASGSIAGIGGLVDGASHTVYVALVDGDLVDATVEPASRASAAFSVGILPTEFVRVVSKQGGAGTTTAIPIEVYAVPVDTVTGVDLDLHYDETILTPTSDAGVLSAVTINATLVPADWTILQNISSPGVLSVSLASAFANALTGGEILSVAFDVAVGAVAGTQTPLTLTGVRLNEDEVDSTGVAGLFTVLNVVYGDVTGDGTISAYDASWVLEWVANDLAGTPIVFPIEENAPMWASLPLTGPEALEVADVDDDGFITAMDASDILRKRVGIIDLFVAEGGAPSAPSSAPGAAVYSLRGLALSERPGAQVTVTLDASAMADLYGGELVLDFDPSLLRPVDVALRRHDARDAMQRPLLTQSEGDGRLAVAFASARPIEASDALLEVTFEATRDISHARESAIRASHLRLNRSKIETDFAFPFRVEPFANRLMANYPNPFNPETWIPFELAADSHVEVRVYGLDGSVVRTVELGRRAIGEYRTRDEAAYWDGRNESGEHVASGVYVYELLAGEQRAVRRMVISK